MGHWERKTIAKCVSGTWLACSAVIVFCAAFILICSEPPALAQQDWTSYGHDPGPADYSTLSQITPGNVSKLQQVWVYHYGAGDSDAGDMGLDYRFEITPLVVNGVMYISSPASPRKPDLKAAIVALEPETGKVIWKYESPENIHGRGIAYWPGDSTAGPRIVFATNHAYLSAVDAKTGKLVDSFGENGQVDLYSGVVSDRVQPIWRDRYTVPNPVTIYRNLVITGARPGELGPPGPRGDIRAWDARSGKLVWTFHTVPQPGEANHETWPGDSWKDRTGVNVWSLMTLDSKLGIVYAGLGSASTDSNGADRPGPDLYANTLVALNAATGKLLWFHQLTHHDLWDFDLPTPPALVDVTHDGKVIPAVAQAGKMGFLFIYDRRNGHPVYSIEERPAPKGDDPNDPTWPTQPIPTVTPPIARVSMTRDEIAKVTPDLEAYCTKVWDDNHVQNFGPYTPNLSDVATVNFPNGTGGANWSHPSFDPKLSLLFVNVSNNGGLHVPRPANAGATPTANVPPADEAPARGPAGRAGRFGPSFMLNGLPCWQPPWGELIAVNVNTGKIAWRESLGTTPSLGDKGLNTGAFNLGGSISTASGLIFIAATADKHFRAFDAEDGAVLWDFQLPASGHATPITYTGKDGKQYVVVAAAGGTAIDRSGHLSDALVAFSLP
jgi:glucose dehydrogenase